MPISPSICADPAHQKLRILSVVRRTNWNYNKLFKLKVVNISSGHQFEIYSNQVRHIDLECMCEMPALSVGFHSDLNEVPSECVGFRISTVLRFADLYGQW